MNQIGFKPGSKDKSLKEIYESYIGKPGHYGVGSTIATGILKKIDLIEGYLSIQPSIVGIGDSKVRVEDENPTIISIEPGQPISIRPLKEGDFERILKAHNEEKKDKKDSQVDIPEF